MLAMQYAITLPADYDMAIIRRRIADKGHMLDSFPGLGLKAYLLRERGVRGSSVNQYAPFYIWTSVDAMRQFLWEGAGFGGLLAAFGRPRVEHWLVAASARGPSYGQAPRAVTRHDGKLPADIDPQQFAADLKLQAQALARTPGVCQVTFAIDILNWAVVRFTLWDALQDNDGEQTAFELLHLSSPEIGAII